MISFAVVIFTVFIFELKIPKSSIVPISFLHSSCNFLSWLNCFKNMASNHLEIIVPPKNWLPSHFFPVQFHYQLLARACVLSRASRVQLCDPRDNSLSGSSVHGILQARIMEWVAMLSSATRILERVAMLSSMESSWPRDQTLVSYVSCNCRRVLYC